MNKPEALFRALALTATLVSTAVATPAGVQADSLRKGTTVLVSTNPDGSPADGGFPSVSSDGRYVAFESWHRLTTEDTDSDLDIFRKDMTTGVTILVSTNGNFAEWNNIRPSISGDGNKVAYLAGPCYYHNFISAIPSCIGVYAYVRDIASGAITKVSDSNAQANDVDLSRDGSYAVVSQEGDEELTWVTVVRISDGMRTHIATVCSCAVEKQADISGNGRFVVFESKHWHDPVDTDDRDDVYLHDRDPDGNGVFDETGKTSNKLVGIRPQGDSPFAGYSTISDDGRYVAYVGGDYADPTRYFAVNLRLYVRDIALETTYLASKNSLGITSAGPDVGEVSSLSADGTLVGFASNDPHMGLDTNPFFDVFVHDRASKKTALASTKPDGSQDIIDSYRPSLSADGRFVAFETTVGLDGTQEGTRINRRIYLRDLTTPCQIYCVEESVPSVVPDVPHPSHVVTVDSRQSSPSFSPQLRNAAVTYTLTASGVYDFALGAGRYLADAECSTTDGVNWSPSAFGETNLDLLIDQAAISWKPLPGTESQSSPECSTTHTYTTTVVGAAKALAFLISDSLYQDNAGWLKVVIQPQ